jgi:hypothetical protein
VSMTGPSAAVANNGSSAHHEGSNEQNREKPDASCKQNRHARHVTLNEEHSFVDPACRHRPTSGAAINHFNQTGLIVRFFQASAAHPCAAARASYRFGNLRAVPLLLDRLSTRCLSCTHAVRLPVRAAFRFDRRQNAKQMQRCAALRGA